jgi:hypothetical protein
MCVCHSLRGRRAGIPRRKPSTTIGGKAGAPISFLQGAVGRQLNLFFDRLEPDENCPPYREGTSVASGSHGLRRAPIPAPARPIIELLSSLAGAVTGPRQPAGPFRAAEARRVQER